MNYIDVPDGGCFALNSSFKLEGTDKHIMIK